MYGHRYIAVSFTVAACTALNSFSLPKQARREKYSYFPGPIHLPSAKKRE
jgi:hypothetical protein